MTSIHVFIQLDVDDLILSDTYLFSINIGGTNNNILLTNIDADSHPDTDRGLELNEEIKAKSINLNNIAYSSNSKLRFSPILWKPETKMSYIKSLWYSLVKICTLLLCNIN